MASPNDSAMNFAVNWNLNEEEFKTAANNMSNSFDKLDKMVGSVVSHFSMLTGVITGLVGAGYQWDNFLGLLNTKVSKTNDGLRHLGDAIKNIANQQGSMMYGLSLGQQEDIGMAFATQATIKDKQNKNMAQNFTGFGNASAALMKNMDMSVEDSVSTITNFRKQLGMSYENMTGFAEKLGNISKTANLTGKQIKGVVDQSTKLAVAYGMAGASGERFIENQLKQASVMSQLGLNAQDLQNKLNSLASGSEEGAVQAMLLGYDPTSSKDITPDLISRAKQLTGLTDSMPVQLRNMMIEQMKSGLGLGSFGVQDIRSLSKEGKLEMQQAGLTMESVLNDLTTYLKDERNAKEKPYVTAGQEMTQLIKTLQVLLIDKFGGLLEDLKGMLHTFTKDWVPKIGGWIDNVGNFFQKMTGHGLDLTGIAVGLTAFRVGLALVTTGIQALAGALFTKSVASTVAGGAATSLLGTSMGGIASLGIGAIVTATAAVIATAGVSYLFGTAINKWLLSDEIKKNIGDSLIKDVKEGSMLENWLGIQKSHSVGDLGKYGNMSDESKAELRRSKFGEQTNEPIKWDKTEIAKIGEAMGFMVSSHNEQDLKNKVHDPNSQHNKNLADDFSIKGKTSAEINNLIDTLRKQGLNAFLEAKPGVNIADDIKKQYILRNANATETHVHAGYKGYADEVAVKKPTDILNKSIVNNMSDEEKAKAKNKVEDPTTHEHLADIKQLLKDGALSNNQQSTYYASNLDSSNNPNNAWGGTTLDRFSGQPYSPEGLNNNR